MGIKRDMELSSLVDEVKPMFEKMPERITYNVASLELSH
jgi:hypothetical protein